MRITVTAWRNGSSGYGLNIRREDVRHFPRQWGKVTIELPDGTVAYPNIDKDSFYNNCPHLIHKNIKRWLHNQGYLPWPDGEPPESKLGLLNQENGVFRLYDNQI